jgi:hypothetical protein
MVTAHERPDPVDTPGAARDTGTGRSGVADEARQLTAAAVAAVGRTGTISAAAVADAVENTARSLTRRVVDGAIEAGPAAARHDDLARALAERPRAPMLASATGAAFAARALSRIGPLRFLARRTPMWLVASAVPALAASVMRGSHELGLVASHLAARARAAGIEPDPERLRRAAVQLVSGAEVDPDSEPRHGLVAVMWLKRAARAALPFTSGVATSHPDTLAAAATAVDPALLR